MPRKPKIPKIIYKQSEQADQTAVDSVFDYIFGKVLESESKNISLEKTAKPDKPDHLKG